MKVNPFSKIKNKISACFETNTLKSVLSDAGIKRNLMIFDIGAHKGQTSSHFCTLFPHSFMPLSLLHTFLLKSRKTYPKGKTLYAITLPWGKPMKKHFSPNLIPTYVVKSSKPKKTIPAVSQSIGLMDSAKLKTFLQLTF